MNQFVVTSIEAGKLIVYNFNIFNTNKLQSIRLNNIKIIINYLYVISGSKHNTTRKFLNNIILKSDVA